MQLSYVEVRFYGQPHDRAIEAAVCRWVARLECMRFEIQRAFVTIERSGRHRTTVGLAIALSSGLRASAITAHADTYVAVANAFREVRRQLSSCAPDGTEPLVAVP